MRRLPITTYLTFPLRITAEGPVTSGRSDHVKQQIEQVLWTSPGERVFRPEFGAGLRQLVFEPNASTLWELTRKRLLTSLAEALQGEVDPRPLEVTVEGQDPDTGEIAETLYIRVSYQLAALGQREEVLLPITLGGGSTNG